MIRYKPDIPLEKAILLKEQNGLYSGKYLILIYQQIQERLCWLKKDKITLCDGCLLCAIVKQ